MLGVFDDGGLWSAAVVRRTGGSLDTVDGNLETAQLVLQRALDDVNTARGEIGSFQTNTIESALNSRRVARENLASAYSGIADTDFAAEVANLRVGQLAVKASILAVDLTLETRSSILDLFA